MKASHLYEDLLINATVTILSRSTKSLLRFDTKRTLMQGQTREALWVLSWAPSCIQLRIERCANIPHVHSRLS